MAAIESTNPGEEHDLSFVLKAGNRIADQFFLEANIKSLKVSTIIKCCPTSPDVASSKVTFKTDRHRLRMYCKKNKICVFPVNTASDQES